MPHAQENLNFAVRHLKSDFPRGNLLARQQSICGTIKLLHSRLKTDEERNSDARKISAVHSIEILLFLESWHPLSSGLIGELHIPLPQVVSPFHPITPVSLLDFMPVKSIRL
jgi:hypothetical protein